jgi:GH35 family endo-1,4-beta-xylanase
MADSFPNPEQNRRYEETFKGAFNFATAPFYWAALEPEEGKPRFEAGSPPIYRRPPPDVVVRFCQRNGIVIKGHTLLYHGEHLPTWLSGDRQEAAVQIRRHFEQIAQRYGKEVSVWDVVNEPLDSFRFDKGKALPQDYTYWAMKTAELLFPPNSVLMVNHNHPVWADALRLAEESHYYLLVHNLLLRNARVDAIGIQLHTGYGTDFEDMLAGKKWRPCDLLTVLDLFSRLQRPLHITEITFPTRPEGPQGEETQACVLRNLYRLWFSHRNVEAITYWDLVDGTTWQDAWHGGLLRKDLSPKPAYLALDKLINHEWKTNLKLTTDAQGQATFRGFYGKYQVKVVSSGKTQIFEINHRQRGPKDYRLSLKD